MFERARQVADAVLYEGYLLYPYRASARKNQVRWQFGVAAPRQWSEGGGCEHWWMQTECLVEAGDAVRLVGKVRFLHLQRRSVEEAVGENTFRPVESLEVDGRLWMTWDEAVERDVDFDVRGAADEQVIAFTFPAGREIEEIRTQSGALAGHCVRERWPLSGMLRIGFLHAGEERERGRLARWMGRPAPPTPPPNSSSACGSRTSRPAPTRARCATR